MLTVLGALAVVAFITIVVARIATGPITWIWSKKESSNDSTQEESDAVYRFRYGWGQIPLPIRGIVDLIDHGDPGVGLSAMQMDALGVGRGLVRLEFRGRSCDAKVWNAFGPDAMRGGPELIRITDSLARKLCCSYGDKIRFVKILKTNLSATVLY